MPDIIGYINIAVTPSGNVEVRAGGPELLLRGALHKAMEQLSLEWQRQAEGPKIAVPSPEMVGQLNGIAT